ncbi:MAG: helix-turn-helix domain-containing protein [Sphingorhabdus sp.]
MNDRDFETMNSADMTDDLPSDESVGAILRSAREKAGLSLTEIASRTRVPIRHLEAIEASDYGALPGSTYTLGFTKSYAKALGMDENAITAEMREELAQGGFHGVTPRAPAYEPTDPARVPSRPTAWIAATVAAVALGAYFIWRSFALSPDASTIEKSKTVAEAPIKGGNGKTAPAPAAASGGPVVITATDTVWVRIYDADNTRLYENEMKAGDSFTVPANANNPMIVTGLPQVLNVTVGGVAVPPLGTGEQSISDVGISAAALLARPAPANASAATKTGATDN